MKEIDAAEFKEQCLQLLGRLDADGLIVTKNGEPIARVTPYELFHEMRGSDLIGSLCHKITVKGDVFSTGLRWEAEVQS